MRADTGRYQSLAKRGTPAPCLVSARARNFPTENCQIQGGSEFGAVPAATGRSRHHRSRSTWGLVSRFIGPYLTWFTAIWLSRDLKRAKVPGNPLKNSFCFGFLWGVIFKKKLFSLVDSRIT